jgi:hypothetical protein
VSDIAAREQLLAIVDARLAAVEGVASYEAEPSGDPAEFPALASFDGGQQPTDDTEAGATRYVMGLTVEGYVEGGGGAPARAARSLLHARVVAALMTEPPLGGLAESIEEAGELRLDTAELASKRRLAFAQDFAIQFSTVRGDPATFA